MKISWLTLAFFGFMSLAAIFVTYNPTQKEPSEVEITVPFFENLINKIGPKKAYEEFALITSKLDQQKQHNAAHIFGEALYRTKSLEGLPFCDARFSNGCFHSLSALAIAEGSLETTVPQMVSVCNKESTIALEHSCLHGVGHGIQAYLGYSEENLSEAIKICSEKTNGNLTAGCWGGVFMEYNIRTLQGEDSLRTLNEATRYTPCDSLDADLKPSCMFWQPEWWESMITNTTNYSEFFTEVGGYCTELSEEQVRKACFAGLGSIISARVTDIDEGSSMCRLIALTAQDAIACWSFVYNKTPYSEKTEAALKNFCTGYKDDELEYCNEHKYTSADIFNERNEAIFP